MNSKKILVCLASIASLNAALSAGGVAVWRSSEILNKSRYFQKKYHEPRVAEEREFLEYKQSVDGAIQAKKEKLQGDLPLMKPEAQQRELLDLHMAELDANYNKKLREEKILANRQVREESIRRELIQSASDLNEKNQWGVLVDASQPGVLACQSSLDVTSDLIAGIDAALVDADQVQMASAQSVDERVTA